MKQIPTKMNAILMTANGDYDKLKYVSDYNTPIPKENEVLIEVKAAGVNNTDINTRIAWYSKNDNSSDDASWSGNSLEFPRIQGADVCGYIVAVGKNIDEKRIGQRVLIEPSLQKVNGDQLENPWYFGSECDGGFAQYTVVSNEHAHEIQSEYSDTELASFPCSYSTAENLLTRANVNKNDIVLISGASGGVGSAAIQLARARGAKVIAITSASKFETIKALGASTVVSREDNLPDVLGKNSVTVVIDLVAGEKWNEFLEVLKPKGRYAVSGAIGGAIVELDIRTLYLKDLSFFGCTILEDEVFPNLIKRIERKEIKPLLAKIYKLKDIVKAQKEFLTKKHIGKIVLEVV
ncbi:MAG: alcohol dehydrogenase [Arcobacter sp.]|jgi:NADPH:quinone reductase-like Zn-dependent oxidoreductase|uniref:alcohol dehydrogenase family protein n=1 Tax=Poseidonibacter ostreae TaxID=2654171 RepID=UPI000C8EA253|nr:alcohol dehydrogenase family protein [Poseidonibacter ostreae]KAB7888324.1 zinc-binding dehydrogenase [Poseidonibacter ostreae]MAC83035.1 alcohol dehydrogenase [Arcobacter sp.]|tara:strand:+ start:9430 stop:10479 length:1050 start_codon:yes stop_codon:yes gene_type:complete